jgi:hypothetical protein
MSIQLTPTTQPLANQIASNLSSMGHAPLLLDVILVGRTQKLVSIIFIDHQGIITLTEPSNKHNIPLLSNCPKSWFIPTINLTCPNSTNLSAIEVTFEEKEKGIEVWAISSKDKDLKKLEAFLDHQNSLQEFLKKNSNIRNTIFDQVTKKEWDYSKHIPWNMVKIIDNKEKSRKTFSLKKSSPIIG